MAAGARHSVALKTDGSLWSWGANYGGQLGDGTTVPKLVPTKVGEANDWSAVAAGSEYTVARKLDGSLWTWGRNGRGQLGDGTTKEKKVPTRAGLSNDWELMVAGWDHMVALKRDGSLWAWGDNSSGQLGNGTSANRSVPKQVSEFSAWAAVAIGNDHAVGLKGNGSLWAWGENFFGQLGDGTSVDKHVPVRVGEASDWASVTVGQSHTMAVKTDGSLWAWGNNHDGQLGDGRIFEFDFKRVPTRVGDASDWAAVTAGRYHTVAVKTDGSLWAWGGNGEGQLGDGTTESKYVPTRVGEANDWVAVDSGIWDYVVALKSDGSIWAWGNNSHGQLGDGTQEDRKFPTQVGEASDWASVVAGYQHTVALKTDGTLWAWGDNFWGGLGVGTRVGTGGGRVNVPTRVGESSDWVAVAPGWGHSVGLKSNGSLWAWGANHNGQLGDGTFKHRNKPLRVGLSEDWSLIAVGGDSLTAAVRSDGTLWSWGSNFRHQLGNGLDWIVNTPTLAMNTFDDPPVISMIPEKATSENQVIGPIEIIVSDADTPLDDLRLLIESSDSSLVQPDGISIDGSGAHRTLTILPMPNQIGKATITVVVSDGSFTDRTSFELLINPGNDDWTDALEISGLDARVFGSTFGATKETDELNHAGDAGGNSVWWSWTASVNSTVSVSTEGSAFDTVLGVYTGESASSLDLVARNSAAVGGSWSQVDFQALAGTTFWIAVDGFNGSVGDIVLSLNAVEGNLDPVISGLGSREVTTGETVGPIEFAVNDAETAASKLVVRASSSNLVLVPEENIVLAGSQSNRTLTVTPQVGESGIARISVEVTDGGGKTVSGSLMISVIGNAKVDGVRVATGESHAILIKEDGTLWSWGRNRYGQLGDGTTEDKNVPVQVAQATNWAEVAIGLRHSIALKSDGSLWAWGWNRYGQLGDGTTEDKSLPTQIGTDTDWAVVIPGLWHTMALKTDGSLWAWGWNRYGQLGDGTTDDKNSPRQVGGGADWRDVAAGGFHTVALKRDGSIWAWGNNFYGQLGDGTTASRQVPIRIGQDSGWVDLAAGRTHTIVLDIDGRLWSWGRNNYGQLGDGTTDNKNALTQVGEASDWADVAVGSHHTVALKSDGRAFSWGYNENGQLGDGTTDDKLVPTQVSEVSEWTLVSVGDEHTMALKSDGQLWSWGKDLYGQLGVETNEKKSVPRQVGEGTDWAGVAVGLYHTVALKTEGSLWTWGRNLYGQLGDGTSEGRNVAMQVGQGTDWTDAVAGEQHTVALKSDGSLWAWGRNLYGQLGDGTTEDKNGPTQVGQDTDWTGVAAGDFHTVALKADGSLWAWGRNSYGQLGDGTTDDKHGPTKVGQATDWADLVAGLYHTVALKNDGSLWAWGRNDNGQLGDGIAEDKSLPTQVGTATDWTDVAAGSNHTVALKIGGSVWAWGDGGNGQLGDGTIEDKTVPTRVGEATDWAVVSAGENHTVALKNDGSLWAWGANHQGQLGDGSYRSRITPLHVGFSAEWLSVSADFWHTAAIRSDGTLWTWGLNTFGQLGNGRFSRVSSPTPSLSVHNVPPSISIIPNQFSSKNVAAGPIEITILDSDTPLGDLKLSAESSDSLLVQPEGVSFGGSGGQRTLTILPMPTQTGQVTITVLVSDGSFSDSKRFVLTVSPELPVFIELSGSVSYYAGNRSVPDIQMSLDGDLAESAITDSGGLYRFTDLYGNGSFSVVPSDKTEARFTRGVTSLDLALIRRHILGIRLLDSPYKILASDVNDSQSVTTLDLALIWRLILALSDTYPAGLWKFVPSDYHFSDPEQPWNVQSTRDYSGISQDLIGQDFIGIKLGDVNGSWTPRGGAAQALASFDGSGIGATEQLSGKRATRSLGRLNVSPKNPPVGSGTIVTFGLGELRTRDGFGNNFRADAVEGKGSETVSGQATEINMGNSTGSSLNPKVSVPVTVAGFRDVTSVQFTMEWDPTVLRLIGVGDYNLPGLQEINFGSQLSSQGKLTFSWYDSNALGVSLADGNSIFSVAFEELKPQRLGSSSVRLVNDPTVKEVSVRSQPAEFNVKEAGFRSTDY